MKTRMRWMGLLGALLLGAGMLPGCSSQRNEKYTETSFMMDTVITQTAYGKDAQGAMQEVTAALQQYESRMSLYKEGSDIQKINQMAGKESVEVNQQTADLLRQGLALSAQSQGSFALSIAPLTLGWNIGGEEPVVLSQQQIEELMPLVDDSAVKVEGNTVTLPKQGMGLDLGGIAKGAACNVARDVYEQKGVESALLSIGGNIYARGTKPDGSLWTVGFRDPEKDANSYIAHFQMQDMVIAVSGGYERYFEKDGVRYIHIIDPRTGMPAVSDIVSVGVLSPDGAVADFYSTTFYLWGRDKTLEFMKTKPDVQVILLDGENRLYVSAGLQESFTLEEQTKDGYTLEFVSLEDKK